MKKHKNSKNGNGHSPTIRIEFTDPIAATVAIAGTFNDWRPEATPMLRVGSDHWVKDLVLPIGTYEYRLVVDGMWISDPAAPESTPNPFGGRNSILRIKPAEV